MAGAFQTSREIFENPIWQNVVEFRLFFLIYGKATFTDGVKVGDIVLKRGQWLRSYRNLQSDLEYVENRTIKKYSLSRIYRAVDSLLKQKRVRVERVELGTLFEVVNYAIYQGLENYKSDIRNSDGTEMEQRWNNNKKEKKEKKNIYSDLISTFTENEALKKAINDYIDMRIEIKKVPTAHALELIFKTLKPFDIETQIKMLENSTVGNWTGVFPLKEQPIKEKPKYEFEKVVD